MRNVLMVFVDGLGLGKNDPESNPLAYTPTPHLSALLNRGKLTREHVGTYGEKVSLLALDCTMGVGGKPQSATGQASLFTGEKAPRLLGYHLNGFPNSVLRNLIKEKSLFKSLLEQSLKVAFINAYRPEFFIDLQSGLPLRRSCSTLMTHYAGAYFRSLEDLEAGNAVYMDITNHTLIKRGYRARLITPEEAARRAVNLARCHHFALFEYFLTDIAGHEMDREQARECISHLDDFTGHLVDLLDLESTLFLLVSDHGNVEEMDHDRHTLNPVPLIIGGSPYYRKAASHNLTDISEVALFIIDYLINR